jgi:poly-gamma-glutamate capsule biosynthesis protein CapA/YwtB (metallophosphatase superfamily)
MPVFHVFLAGDVMTGRGIDQILPYPSRPAIHEPVVRDARGCVELAEAAHGPIPRPIEDAYIWAMPSKNWTGLRPWRASSTSKRL